MNNSHDRFEMGLFALACLALFCVACGGGGGAAAGPTTPLGTTVAEVEFESFQLANAARRDNNVQPQLGLDDAVTRVARAHSEAMRDQGFFGHQGPGGDLASRLRAAGVQFRNAGENLARISSAPNPAGEAHAQFLDSAQHRNVMLNGRFQLAGVGVARSGDTYWLTQIYIRP